MVFYTPPRSWQKEAKNLTNCLAAAALPRKDRQNTSQPNQVGFLFVFDDEICYN